MICRFCGKNLPEESTFCSQCGKNQSDCPTSIRIEKPVSIGAYFGLLLLFVLPIIGFFAALIVALVAKNRNLKNFAIAAVIWTVIATFIGFAILGISFWVISDQVLPETYWLDHYDPFEDFEHWEEFEDHLPIHPYF